MNTNKETLTNKVYRCGGYDRKAAKKAVADVFDALKEMVVQGRVSVRGFGSFVIEKRKSKIGQDINRGVSVRIPARHKIIFRASEELEKSVQRNSLTSRR
ncbi:HU family DNA-binding protein [Dyadobacter sp. BHUBP1]|uniref:HU family DNA-binding protein n=1 Tax=Dyadobacter sp. BHUBP1 TaxID=3424178 RepID=UPI003D358591